jgi:hypothetical protein
MCHGAALLASGIAAVDVMVIAVATTVCDLLCCLDEKRIALEPLVVGDLRPLLLGEPFRAAFPSCQLPIAMLSFAPAACVAVPIAALAAAARRWPRVSTNAYATLALLAGTVPFAVGVVALQGNTVPERSGPWLQWQLTGPALAAVASLAFLAWGCCRRVLDRVATDAHERRAAVASAAR